MWQLLAGLGGVPKMLVWDNESGIGQHRRLTVGARSFAGTLGTRIYQAAPRDPGTKGVVERANGFRCVSGSAAAVCRCGMTPGLLCCRGRGSRRRGRWRPGSGLCPLRPRCASPGSDSHRRRSRRARFLAFARGLSNAPGSR
jgi:hypothetical protein